MSGFNKLSQNPPTVRKAAIKLAFLLDDGNAGFFESELDDLLAALAQPIGFPADLAIDFDLAADTIGKVKANATAVVPQRIEPEGFRAVIALAEWGLGEVDNFAHRMQEDRRAVEAWRAANPDSSPIWPTRTDLTCWLLEVMDVGFKGPTIEQADLMMKKLWTASLTGNPIAGEARTFMGTLADELRKASRRAFIAERARDQAILNSERADQQDENAGLIAALDFLRGEEADTVKLLCDNPDEGPANAIECSGFWTGFRDLRFEGDSMLEAIGKAHMAKVEAQRVGYPEINQRVIAEDEGMPADMLDALDLLGEAAALFRSYEAQHRAKGQDIVDTPNTIIDETTLREIREKAERNAKMAARIEAFLTPERVLGDQMRPEFRAVVGLDLAKPGSDATAYVERGPNGIRAISEEEYHRKYGMNHGGSGIGDVIRDWKGVRPADLGPHGDEEPA